jgi:hypothetical protein
MLPASKVFPPALTVGPLLVFWKFSIRTEPWPLDDAQACTTVPTEFDDESIREISPVLQLLTSIPVPQLMKFMSINVAKNCESTPIAVLHPVKVTLLNRYC